MSDFKVIGKVLSLKEEEFVSSKNKPYIKVILTLEYECDFYSWRKNEWYKFPKILILEHLLTRYVVDKDPLYEELYVFNIESSNKVTWVEVGFWIVSEERKITTNSGYEMTVVDHKFKINTIKMTSPPSGEYGDIKDTENDFVDEPEETDDLPF